MYSSELLKGSLKTIVMQQLKEHGKMYGYEITQKVKEISSNKIQLTEGALYPALHALEAEGFLTTETEFIGKRVRKYYSLTPTGQNKVLEKINEFAEFVSTMKLILQLETKKV
ncbi:MAG: helix-turn-helix transcriptional regulator [Bacteroidia bacterium]